MGLDLFLSPDPKEYYSYTRPFYGIQVAIHQQEDYPDMKSHILVQPGYDVKVLITPSVLISDQAVCIEFEIDLNTFEIFTFFSFF